MAVNIYTPAVAVRNRTLAKHFRCLTVQKDLSTW